MKIILLAAGLSIRAGGRQKAVRFYKGRPLVAYPLDAALSVADTIVVTGHERGEVERVALDTYTKGGYGHELNFAYNPVFAQGQLSSALCGLSMVDDDDFAFMLSDMPNVSAGIVNELVGAFYGGGDCDILRPVAGGRPGHPIIFKRECKKVLLSHVKDAAFSNMRDILQVENNWKVKKYQLSDDDVFADVDYLNDFK